MRGFFVLVPVFLVAGFSPPDALPPQGVQEGPPKSWIPEKAPKPPITVTPELPKQAVPQPGNPGQGRALSIIPEACAAKQQGGKPSEAFVNAYNEAKTNIAGKDYSAGLARSREAEAFAGSFQMKAALLAMQMVIASGLNDSDLLEEAIAKRTALGCLTANEIDSFEKARQTIAAGKTPQ